MEWMHLAVGQKNSPSMYLTTGRQPSRAPRSRQLSQESGRDSIDALRHLGRLRRRRCAVVERTALQIKYPLPLQVRCVLPSIAGRRNICPISLNTRTSRLCVLHIRTSLSGAADIQAHDFDMLPRHSHVSAVPRCRCIAADQSAIVHMY